MDYTNYTREQLIETITELKMLNKQLLLEKEQEAKLDFAWTGNLGHWYFNIKTGTVVFNPLKVEVLGYTMEDLPEKVSYRFFTDKLHPDDYENTMNAMRRNMDGTADVYECEYRLQAKDGSWKWLYDRGKVTQRDANGNPEFAAGIVFDITDQKEKEIQLQSENRILEERSTKDALTGIHNRRAIMEELEKRINQSLNYGSPLCIGLLDIDHFKAINDTKGHVEFLIIFPNTRQEGARLVCERIRTNIEEFDFGDGLQLTVSGGVAEYRIGQSLTEFIDQADTKLYEAKTSGRNRIKIT